MSDEVHLLMSRNSYTGIDSVIRKLQLEYCSYFNNAHRRTVRLLKLVNVSGAIPRYVDLLGYYRYIELIPVMAGVVDHPSEYPWSSYGSNAMGEDCGLVSPHHVYISIAADDQLRREHYRNGFDKITALTGTP
jgi:putative transposase